jgi:uncharacterized protein
MNHDRYSDDYIHGILSGVKAVALVGVSTNPARASNFVLRYLLQKNYRAYAVNPLYAGETVAGQTIHASLADVPEPIDMVEIFRRADAVPAVVDEVLALEPRPKVIWMQLGVRHEEAAAKAEAAGLDVVMNRCAKIEYGRMSGEIAWFGVNTQRISSRKPVMSKTPQALDLGGR